MRHAVPMRGSHAARTSEGVSGSPRWGAMRQTILLSIVVIAAFTGCGRRTTTTTATMNCTLDICGHKKIQNPTESDLRQAVFALDTKKEDAFLILGPTDMTYIQATGDQKVGFVLEYQDTDAKHHYRAKRRGLYPVDRGWPRCDLTADEIVKALVSYSTGADDWKTMAEWELIKL
jgi:hypothetical protein